MRHRFLRKWRGISLLGFSLFISALVGFCCVTLVDVTPVMAAADDTSLDEGDTTDASEPEGAAKKKEQRLLAWVWAALGPGFTLIFLGLSFTLVALFVMNVLTARRENVVPLGLVEGFEAHLNEKRYQEAYEMAKNDDSFLGQVLSAGLGKLSAGYPQAIEAMQEVGEEENMKLEHRLGYMALIGTISPMFGLFGTVWGMIGAFMKLGTGGETNAKLLAQDISTALLTTLLGLAIAIPAIAIFAILRNRIARLVLEVGILSEDLMSRFSNVGGAGAGTAKKS